jgi:methylated-DNA-[protein]-cysteine S-methyltransferase
MAGAEMSGEFVITGISLSPDRQITGNLTKKHHPELIRFSTILQEHYHHGRGNLAEVKISLDGFSPFRKKVMAAARKINRGHTVSYQTLAQVAGFPKAFRAAASVMRKNPYPLVVPCHRVIMSNGSLGGFQGCKKGAPVELKRRLLDIEKQYNN